ncbi:hypothetical protein FHT82_005533 [Rhizobium sp. BK275]|uniref:hypothetical protein n=1 Tax=unclassified Rhizobium TaxID=2613769 RepID=UPI001619C6EC|nr:MULTISPECIES: hypothetical protein [unclassified Rhizobium]MBB3392744.1 hypothetical protein [Rhizobium sp. BK275]MBB3412103.1 hypothetical protein [Rhizobium sp. BK316]
MSRRKFKRLTHRLLGRFDDVQSLLDGIEGSALKLQATCDDEAETEDVIHPTVQPPQWPRRGAAPAAL